MVNIWDNGLMVYRYILFLFGIYIKEFHFRMDMVFIFGILFEQKNLNMH
jgi:hypothetical protein